MQSESIPRNISKLSWQKMVRFFIAPLFNKTIPFVWNKATKTPSSSPQEGWAGGQPNAVRAQQKTSALNP